MKINYLKIRNIASIEKADIDFNGPQLADQDLFLICGPTGSGKTTILDAICLALFNNTPRIVNSNNDSVDEYSDDAHNFKSIKTPKNLMRKNAVDALAELTFVGADDRVYVARWTAHRSQQYDKNGNVRNAFAKENLSERLKRSIQWGWTLIDDEDRQENNQKVLKERIPEIIGLTFDQFCKTTMLAQGDFTKFLSSDKDDKAKILEKLVGTEKFREVGCAINQKANEKKREYEKAKNDLENIQFLTQEERQEKDRKIAETEGQIKSLTSAQDAIKVKLDWIKESKRITDDEANAQARVERATADLEDEKSKKESDTIALWDGTATLREHLNGREECTKTTEECRRQESALAAEYDRILSGMSFLTQSIDSLREVNDTVEQRINSQSQFAEMFGNLNAILAKHDAIVSNQSFVSSESKKLTEYNAALNLLNEKKSELEKSKAQNEADIKAKEESVTQNENSLKALGADTLTKDIREVLNKRKQLSETSDLLKARNEANEDLTQKRQAQREKSSKVEALKKAAKEAAEKYDAAKKQRDASKETYDRTHRAVEDHASALRAVVKVGEECPVCRQKITKLSSEEELKRLLAPLQEKYERDEDALSAATRAQADAESALRQGIEDAESAANDVGKAENRLREKTTDLEGKCLKADLTYDDSLAETISQAIALLDKQEETLNQRQKSIDEINGIIKRTRDEIKKIRDKTLKPLDDGIKALAQNIEKTSEKLSVAQGQISKANEIIEKNTADIEKEMAPDWHPQNPDNLYTELKEAANSYTEDKDKLEKNKAAISKLEVLLEAVKDIKNKVTKLYPAWRERKPMAAAEVKDLNKAWNNLLSTCTACNTKLSEADIALKKHNEFISDYSNEHGQEALANAEKLRLTDDKEIADMRKRAAERSTAKSNAEALLEKARKEKAALPPSPLAETESAESLAQTSSEIEDKTSVCHQLIGTIQAEIKADEENKKKHGDKKKALEEKEEVWVRWSALDSYLGSTDGKKFRNVAQAFILSDLLDKANAYLTGISDRYELFCNPGTLTIMLRDAYQGGVERPTNTLSGGESFIVSLALALGLSSMQSASLQVDTLFIDEGFGTLSPEFLDPVISALKQLHQKYGRRVGLISHVEALRSFIPVRIEVTRQGLSSSEVTVRS